MAGSSVLAALTLVVLTAAASFFTIAFSSSAWMKYVDSEKKKYHLTFRCGLWEWCGCNSIPNVFERDSSFSWESEEQPGWYIAADVLAAFSLIALLLSLGSTLLASCLARQVAFILQIVFSCASASLLLLTIAVFGDQFTKTQLDTFPASGNWLVGTDWGLGLAILALGLTLVSVIARVMDYRAGSPSHVPPPVTMQPVTHAVQQENMYSQ